MGQKSISMNSSVFHGLPQRPSLLSGLQQHPAPVITAEDPNAPRDKSQYEFHREEHRESRGDPHQIRGCRKKPWDPQSSPLSVGGIPTPLKNMKLSWEG